MPRLSKSEKQRRDDDLIAVIYGNIKRLHLTLSEFCTRCYISEATFHRRVKDPDTFTRGELHRICAIFNISLATLLQGDA